ncbi:MAG: S8 family serine peptidase [Pseudobdellovibrio sp.]
MFTVKTILASFFLLTTLSTSAWAQYSNFFLFSSTTKPFTPIQDAYPDRKLLLDHALILCQKTFLKETITTEAVQNVIHNYFLANPTFLKRVASQDGGWTIDFSYALKPGGFLRLIKNTNSYLISFRQSESTIESIASISLTTNCQEISNSRFTFYNSALRPILRVKLNSKLEIQQSNIMEESIKPGINADLSDSHLIRIGIIDSGIDYNHASLIKKSRPMLGLDLTNPERPPYDYTNSIQNELGGSHYSHGTAVADVASRDANVLLIPARTENKSYLDGPAAEYLASKKVRIINISQGGTKESDWLSLKAAIINHPEILFIASAGNESVNLDTEISYPGNFNLPNLLIIASINQQDELSKFSNYGSTKTHFAAIGENVSAALAGGGQWTVNGTSFAAPQVTNRAAKILSASPSLTAAELKNILIAHARSVPSLIGKIKYGVLD